MTTFKSYKVNERSTIAGLTLGQWAAALPAAAIAFAFVRYMPLALYIRLFFAPLGFGCWMLAVYMAGYLELNLLAFCAHMVTWLRSDERYLAGASPVDRGLLIDRREREPRPQWAFDLIGSDDLERLAQTPYGAGARNGSSPDLVETEES